MSKEKGNPQLGRIPVKYTTSNTDSDGTKARVPHKPSSSVSDKGGKK